jgi:hypothetical protein
MFGFNLGLRLGEIGAGTLPRREILVSWVRASSLGATFLAVPIWQLNSLMEIDSN